jgi:hypothetical protein
MKKLTSIAAIVLLVVLAAWATTIKPSYRATNTTMTITALNSLANSTSQSTGIWGSAFVDNTTNLDVDELVTVEITTGASGVTSTGSFVVYFYGCVGGTTTCTDGVTGSQGTQTLTNPTNLNKVSACNAVANATAYFCGPFSVANSFGGVVPARWGVVVQNLTGGAFAASTNVVTYDSVQMANQ